MVGLEGLKHAQGEWFFGRIMRVGGRVARPLLCGNPLLLEGLVRFYTTQLNLRGRLIEDNAHGNGEFRGHPLSETPGFAPRDSRHCLYRAVYTELNASFKTGLTYCSIGRNMDFPVRINMR